jgi:hypothetical protein
MTHRERHTDIALAVLAGASIAGILWIGSRPLGEVPKRG